MKKRILVSLVISLFILLSIGGIALVQTPVLALEIVFFFWGVAFIGFMCGLLSQTFRKHT